MNIIFRTLAVAFLTFTFVGCRAAPKNYQPDFVQSNYPALGEVVTVAVGEKMLVQGTVAQAQVLTVLEEGGIWGYTISPGTYIKTGADQKYDYYTANQEGATGAIYLMGGTHSRSAAIQISRDKPEKEPCIRRSGDATVCGDLEYVLTTKDIYYPKNFQQTLIYSGKRGSVIQVGYREFSGSIARPAFSNDVFYDLKDSKTIGYKKARIEVIDASNTQITYKVISGF